MHDLDDLAETDVILAMATEGFEEEKNETMPNLINAKALLVGCLHLGSGLLKYMEESEFQDIINNNSDCIETWTFLCVNFPQVLYIIYGKSHNNPPFSWERTL